MNRRAFLESIEATFASGTTMVGILFVDLDLDLDRFERSPSVCSDDTTAGNGRH